VSHLIVFESPFGVVALTRDELQHALAAAAEVRATIALPTPPAASADPDEVLLTAEQAAERTGMSPSWFREAARFNRIPCVRLGRYPRFKWADIQALQRSPTAGSRPSPARRQSKSKQLDQ
jgi:excisionase family DNA binding protein